MEAEIGVKSAPSSTLPSGGSPRSVEFGRHRLDPARGAVLHGSREVHLPAKTYQALLIFLERPGELISKDELFTRLWPDAVVEENNLSQQIAALRRALAAGDPDGVYVETVPRRGYRFVAPVSAARAVRDGSDVDPPAMPAAAPGAVEDPAVSESTRGRLAPPRAVRVAGWAAVLVAFALALFLAGGGWRVGAGGDVGAGPEAVSEPGMRARTSRPIDPDAQDAYLEGRWHWNRRTSAEVRTAARHFELAISIDPTFARAWAGLADAYNLVGDHRRGEAAARRALELDPLDAEAHAALGNVRLFHSWDPVEAERALERSIELAPTYATAHHWLAYAHLSQGHFDRAIESIERARALDALSWILQTDYAEILHFAGRNEDALREIRDALDHDPTFAQAHFVAAEIHLVEGRHDEALRESGLGLTLAGVPPAALADDASGDPGGELLSWLRGLHAEAGGKVWCHHIAAVAAALGDEETSLLELEHALRDRTGALVLAAVRPAFRSLHGNPAFEALIDRVGASPPPDVTAAR
jgi:DNA-binding winged helix-turn-helix (wHTH) protein/Tfp pilus assembly protein PilF